MLPAEPQRDQAGHAVQVVPFHVAKRSAALVILGAIEFNDHTLVAVQAVTAVVTGGTALPLRLWEAVGAFNVMGVPDLQGALRARSDICQHAAE